MSPVQVQNLRNHIPISCHSFFLAQNILVSNNARSVKKMMISFCRDVAVFDLEADDDIQLINSDYEKFSTLKNSMVV